MPTCSDATSADARRSRNQAVGTDVVSYGYLLRSECSAYYV